MPLLNPYIDKIEIINTETIIHLQPQHLLTVINILKKHYLYTQLTSITAIDYPENINRFTIVFQLINIIHLKRLRLKVHTNETNPIPSIVKIFPNAGWYEREIWDLFGVFFINNPDLRRILNDYGFTDHPFRKNFPLIGFHQIRYDDEKKRIISEPVELPQLSRISTILPKH